MPTTEESVIAQREVGADTESFATALRHAFRQDPDVILVGEIRDLETMMIALTAADTGHLVLTTLHTLNAIETISRIISFFPPHQHQQIRLLLSGTLAAVISQRLLPRCDGPGRVPAVEVLLNTGHVTELIIKGEIGKIKDAMEQSTAPGSQTFEQALFQLYSSGQITFEDALANADSATPRPATAARPTATSSSASCATTSPRAPTTWICRLCCAISLLDQENPVGSECV
jgi:pilus retraction protein PilT